MKSPFKFLSAYSKEDKQIFFGREEETRDLYDLIKKNRLVLLYGPSGTGKTSLVSCGLAGKFESTDWYPIRINRGQDINKSLSKALNGILKEIGIEANGSLSEVEAIEEIYAEVLRPVYLIFDQFEELFVFGSAEEQNNFIKTLTTIMDAQMPCRVLIIAREEYIGRLYQFEKSIPSILDRRLRVEPMSRDKLLTVVKSSCESFNVGFDSPEQTPQEIVDNLENVRSGLALPYLQVYLDMLYKRDFFNTYQRERVDNELPELLFSKEEVDKIGEIDNVLELFLAEQIQDIRVKGKEKFPGMEMDFIYRVLDVFVSENATKRPVKYQLEQGYKILPADLLPGLSKDEQEMVSLILKELEANRVLLDNEGSLELAHDSLAAVIDKTRSEQQRRINRIRKRVENAYFEHESSGITLTRDQLYDITSNFKELQPYLKPEWIKLIEKSKAVVEQEENAALAKARKKWRMAILLAIAGFALAGVALVSMYKIKDQLAIIDAQSKEIKILHAKADSILMARQVEIAQSLKTNGNYKEAVDIIGNVQDFAASNYYNLPDSIEMVKQKWQRYANLIAEGDSLVTIGELEKAKATYEQVDRIDPNPYVKYKVSRVDTYNSNLSRASSFEASGNHKMAREHYQKALEIRPTDTRLQQKVRSMSRDRY